MLATIESAGLRTLLSVVAVAVGVVAVVPYVLAMRAGRTRPHSMTWAVWAALTAVGFAAQVAGGGGVASAVLGVSAVICAGIAIYAWRWRHEVSHRSDRYAFAGVVVAALAWAATSNPLAAVALITVVDFAAFMPTVRKTWVLPHTETLSNYALSCVKLLLSAVALEVWSPTTLLYPLSLIVLNMSFVALVVGRRRHVALCEPAVVPAAAI